MKIRVMYANYNEKTGESIVTIATDLGQFTGHSKLAEEDKDIASRYAGCEFAERRAHIKYWKAQKFIYMQRLKALEDLEKNLKGRADYDPYCTECRKIRRAIYEYKELVSECTNKIELMTSQLKEVIIKREETARRVKKMIAK